MADIVVNGVTYNGVEAIAMKGTSGEAVTFYPETAGYLIVFYANGGSCDVFSAYTDASGKLESLPTPTKDGGTFEGWYAEDGTQITTETVFTGDAVAAAKWTVLFTITVTGNGDMRYCYLKINGATVVTAGTFEVEAGSVVTCYAYGEWAGEVYLNGKEMSLDRDSTYSYTVTTNATINLEVDRNYDVDGYITITET